MPDAPGLDHTSVLAVVCLELLVAAPEVPADVPTDVHLGREVGVDSLALREFVARLEYRFGLSVPDVDRPSLSSLEEVAAYVIDRTIDRTIDPTGVWPQPEPASHVNPSGSVTGPASLPMASRCDPVPFGGTPASLAAARRG